MLPDAMHRGIYNNFINFFDVEHRKIKPTVWD